MKIQLVQTSGYEHSVHSIVHLTKDTDAFLFCELIYIDHSENSFRSERVF